MLRFAKTNRRNRPGSPDSAESSDEEVATHVPGHGFVFRTEPRSKNRGASTSNSSHPALIQAIRQPRQPPVDTLQRVLGFAKFLKEHTSPRNKRVTAGGRIVPVGPYSPPPTFQVEHIDTVLRTVTEDSALSEPNIPNTTDKVSNEQSHSTNKAGEPSISFEAGEAGESLDGTSELQHAGLLKIPKRYQILEQVSPTSAIVKMGSTILHASAEGPNGAVAYQTVTLEPGKPMTSLPLSQTMDLDPIQGPLNGAFRVTGHSHPAPMNSTRTLDGCEPYASVPALTYSDQRLIGNLSLSPIPNGLAPVQQQFVSAGARPLTSIDGRMGTESGFGRFIEPPVVYTVSSAHQSGIDAGFEQALGVDIMAELRTATEAYQSADAALKEHEKYTALNEVHMSAREVQLAIEKKKHLILTRDALRKRREHYEQLQIDQFDRFREFEATHNSNWQPLRLPSKRLHSDGQHDVIIQSTTKSTCAAPESTETTSSTSSTFNDRNKKPLSPRAAEFVPTSEVPQQQIRDVAAIMSKSKSQVAQDSTFTQDPKPTPDKDWSTS